MVYPCDNCVFSIPVVLRSKTQLMLVLTVFLAACSSELKPPLVATDIVITEPVPGREMSAAYLSLTNNTNELIDITKITSAEFDAVEIHESLLEGGIARMRQLEKLAVPANSTVKLRPGGKHLMLMRPTKTVDSVSLKFFAGTTLLLGINASIQPRND